MAVDRMSPLDASFLHIEDDVSHMHIGSVSVFEGPPPPYETLSRMVEGKLGLVPRYRQRVRFVPFNLGRPVWAPDPHFSLEYHLRRTALPPPGGDDELRRLVGRVMGQRLDRSRPLWEMWMVEGLDDNRWAIISKVHHAMVDGVSGADLLALLLDLTPDAEPPPPQPWLPGRSPGSWELAANALVDMALSPFEQARALRAATRVPRRAARELAEVLSGFWAAAGVIKPTPATSLNGPIGPHRRWTGTSTPVADVKAVRRALGGSFNDVLLAAVTRGFRDLLLHRGETVDRPLRTLVPVSVRARDSRGMAIGDGSFANKVSAVFADLPVGVADPIERLKLISAQMAGLKESKQAVAGEALTSLSGFAPPALLAMGLRVAMRLSQRNLNTVTTNVPGPQVALYAAGRRMLRCYPYVPLGAQIRVTVAMFSYAGEVSFGVTGDYDSAPDISVLAEGTDAGMMELLAASGTAPAARKGDSARAGAAEAGAGPAGRSPAASRGAKGGEATPAAG